MAYRGYKRYKKKYPNVYRALKKRHGRRYVRRVFSSLRRSRFRRSVRSIVRSFNENKFLTTDGLFQAGSATTPLAAGNWFFINPFMNILKGDNINNRQGESIQPRAIHFKALWSVAQATATAPDVAHHMRVYLVSAPNVLLGQSVDITQASHRSAGILGNLNFVPNTQPIPYIAAQNSILFPDDTGVPWTNCIEQYMLYPDTYNAALKNQPGVGVKIHKFKKFSISRNEITNTPRWRTITLRYKFKPFKVTYRREPTAAVATGQFLEGRNYYLLFHVTSDSAIAIPNEPNVAGCGALPYRLYTHFTDS